MHAGNDAHGGFVAVRISLGRDVANGYAIMRDALSHDWQRLDRTLAQGQ